MYETSVADEEVAAALDGLSGADLAAALVGLVGELSDVGADVRGFGAGLSAFGVVEAVTGFESVVRWAQAAKLALLGRLGDQRGVADSADAALLVGAEVSLALGVGRQSADTLVSDAFALRTRLPMVLTALGSGRVCERGAHAIVQETAVLDGPAAAAVAAAVLARPGLRTVPRIRALTKAAVLRADPATAGQREARAVRGRFVRADHRVEDGMVGWTAWLPAVDSIRIFDRLRDLGEASKAPEDHRSAENRRADVFCDLLLGRPVATVAGEVVDTVNPPGRRVWRTDLVVQASTLQGHDDHPGHVPSWGPVTAGVARRIAAGHTGALDRPEPATATATTCGPVAPDGVASNGVTLSGVASSGATSSGVAAEVGSPTVVSGTGVCADDDRPAQHADPPTGAAGSQLTTDAQWRRILTDPVTGMVTDYGTTRYRPPPALADLIRARDGRCYEPSCTVTAWRADLDHIRPSPAGPSPHPDDDGTTSAGNLAPACRRHHRTKQAPGWAVHADPDRPGTYTWTTPTGHTHVRHAEPPLPWYGHPALEPPQPASGRDQHHHGHHEQPVPAGAGVRPRLETPVERSRLDRLAARARARGVLDLPATPEAPPF